VRKDQDGFSIIEALIILIVIVAIGAAGTIVYIRHHNESVINASLAKIHQDVASAQNSKQSDISTNSLNFTVYQSSYVISGYTPLTQQIFGTTPPYYNSKQPGESIPYSVVYEYQDSSRTVNGQYLNYKISSYATPSDFHPPSSCGLDPVEDTISNCEVIGHSTLGCDIYFAEDSQDKQDDNYEAYCTVGNTTINLGLIGSLISGSQPNSQTEYTQVDQIFNSLTAFSGQVVPEGNL
jgi:type II secretory pathway pseudopilin PulG